MANRACCLLWVAVSLSFANIAGWGQTAVPVGRISGSDFRVRGQVEFASDGSVMLLSGAELEVRAGSARLMVPGGEARFCGPLKVVVLKSAVPNQETKAASAGKQADDLPLLFAVFSNDSGAIEFDYSGTASYTVQTPFFSVTTMPLADPAPRKAAVRVSTTGDICAAAQSGSLRLREQLGTNELMIPPGKAMTIPSAGVDKASPVEITACGCRPAVAAAPPPAGGTPAAAETKPPAEGKPATDTKTTIAAAPLVYEADSRSAPAGPRKEPEVTIPVVTPGPQPAPPAAQSNAESAQGPVASAAPAVPRRGGFGARIKSVFRFLFGSRKVADGR